MCHQEINQLQPRKSGAQNITQEEQNMPHTSQSQDGVQRAQAGCTACPVNPPAQPVLQQYQHQVSNSVARFPKQCLKARRKVIWSSSPCGFTLFREPGGYFRHCTFRINWVTADCISQSMEHICIVPFKLSLDGDSQ